MRLNVSRMQVPAVFDYFDEIPGGVAQVYVYRQIPTCRELQLYAQGFLLLPRELLSVMIVQPYLPDGHGFGGVGRLKRVDLVPPVLADGAGVQPEHVPESSGMPCRQREHPAPFVRIDVGLEHDAHSGIERAAYDFVLAAVECGVEGMGVGVDKLHILQN